MARGADEPPAGSGGSRAQHDPARARTLARELGIEVDAEGCLPGASFFFVKSEGRLELRDRLEPRGHGACVDFSAFARRPRRGALAKREPLARAFHGCLTILDATAGLGQDAFLLAVSGHSVTAVERSAPLAALLADGLGRALEDPALAPHLAATLRVVTGDARNVLAAAEPAPDAVYLDPMFPQKRHASALARKAMRIVRELAGEDLDSAELFAAALRRARLRVVVKRPRGAPYLAGTPDVEYGGKLVRYDAYLTANRRHLAALWGVGAAL